MNKKKVLLFSVAALLSGKTLMAQTGNWKLAGNNLTGTEKLGSTNNQDVRFISNNVVNGVLSKTGFWGLGTAAPSAKLHINGATGEDVLRVQTNGATKLKITANGGVSVGGAASAPSDGLSVFGNVGIGTTNPENFKVKIIHGNNSGSGLALENSTNPGIEWELFVGGGFSPLNLLRNGVLMGQFNAFSGEYTPLVNDALKTNVRPMSPVLEKINQLKLSAYQFKNAANQQEHNDFIAQDAINAFPNLVSHIKQSNGDFYAVNYSGFGVIAIKGIQELMKINEDKDAKIDALQKQIDELKAIVLKENQSSTLSNATVNTSLTDASLEQNAPNPFASATTIHYTLPQKFTTAQIIVTDKSGKTIKQLNISGSGKGVINVGASALSAGTYNYSLAVDGKIISTKQMVVIK